MNARRKTTARKSRSASSTAKKSTAAKTTAKSASSAAETVVNLNNKTIQDMQDSITSETQKAQQQFYEIGREGAEQLAKSADSAGQAVYEITNMCRDNMEACIESSNIAAGICKEIGEEITDFANHGASEAVELSRDLFSCRTLNDLVELQNKVIKNSIDSYFEQCSRLANTTFESFNEICEPINQRVAETTEQLSDLVSGRQ